MPATHHPSRRAVLAGFAAAGATAGLPVRPAPAADPFALVEQGGGVEVARFWLDAPAAVTTHEQMVRHAAAHGHEIAYLSGEDWLDAGRLEAVCAAGDLARWTSVCDDGRRALGADWRYTGRWWTEDGDLVAYFARPARERPSAAMHIGVWRVHSPDCAPERASSL